MTEEKNKKVEDRTEKIDVKESVEKKEEKKEETINKDKNKHEEKKIVKKSEAVVSGRGLRMSLKHAMYISKFIKGKSIDRVLNDLDRVIKKKLAVRFKGEIPHRKGNMMSGRYPVNASKEFIYLLKGLKGNAIVNGMDLDKTKIFYSSPSWGSRPMRRGGMKGKRVNILIKAKEMEKNSEEGENG